MQPTVAVPPHPEAGPPTPDTVTPMLIPVKTCNPQEHTQLRASRGPRLPVRGSPALP